MKHTHIWDGPWPSVIKERLDTLAVLEYKAFEDDDTEFADSLLRRIEHIVAEFDLDFAPIKRDYYEPSP